MRWTAPILLLALLGCFAGCGINRTRLATEQLVIADAVDQAVANIDFSPLSGKEIYFDTKYLMGLKFPQGANVEYVISALRQQMLAYDCRLQEKIEEADFVVEARLGALGNDGVEQTYGVPGTAASTATSLLAGVPVAGVTPELSLGRRNHHLGAAKLGVFAYDRASRQPVWQSGISTGTSQAHDIWFMGFGPFQKGRIYKRNQHPSTLPQLFARQEQPPHEPEQLHAHTQPLIFERALEEPAPNAVRQAAHSTP